MQDFKKLKIWERSQEIAHKIYDITADLPPEERYGVTSQIRRSVISISSNIAEGAGKSTNKDFSRFLDTSMGSLYEVQSLLMFSKFRFNLKADEVENVESELEELAKMIFTFKNRLTGI